MRTARQLLRDQSGLTLEELMIVMAVITNLLGSVMPTVRDFIIEAQVTKAVAELDTLKTAVASYWRNNNYTYPTNITADLINTSPQVVNQILLDPFKTDAIYNTYGYVKGHDPIFGEWFIIYTRGQRGNTTNPYWDSTNTRVVYSGGGVVVSNAAVLKQ